MVGKAMAAGTALVAGAFFWVGAASAAPADPVKPGKDDGSRRICKTITPSGSRLTLRRCKTAAEWDEAMWKTQEGALKQREQGTALSDVSNYGDGRRH
jgi:hypothetical protein